MSEEEIRWWSADEINYINGKAKIDGVTIPSVEAALSLTAFCKKLEKQNLNFNFNLQKVTFQNKEECDSFLKSLNRLRFPKTTQYNMMLFAVERSRLKDEENNEEEVEAEPPIQALETEENKHNPFTE